jgi:hypothetical protein
MEIILSDTEKRLVFAFREGNWDLASGIVQLAQEKQQIDNAEKDLRRRKEDVEKRIATLNGTKEPPKDFVGRVVKLRVTWGSRKHHYLLVTRALEDGVLSGNERLKIHVPATSDTFETDIYVRNKHLTERHKIARFYNAADVKVDEFVVLEERAPREWTLTKHAPVTPSEKRAA